VAADCHVDTILPDCFCWSLRESQQTSERMERLPFHCRPRASETLVTFISRALEVLAGVIYLAPRGASRGSNLVRIKWGLVGQIPVLPRIPNWPKHTRDSPTGLILVFRDDGRSRVCEFRNGMAVPSSRSNFFGCGERSNRLSPRTLFRHDAEGWSSSEPNDRDVADGCVLRLVITNPMTLNCH